MSILRGLLKAILAILLAGFATLALLLLSAPEQQSRRTIAEKTSCPAPEGWSAHLVQVGENLTVLADIVGLEPAELVIANCLQGDLHPGDTILLPPPSPATNTCGPPEGWQLYEIQSGDTLPRLARRFSVSEAALWHANCISESMTFPPGFRLFVPPATDTP
jgi:LysM repeat protein